MYKRAIQQQFKKEQKLDAIREQLKAKEISADPDNFFPSFKPEINSTFKCNEPFLYRNQVWDTKKKVKLHLM